MKKQGNFSESTDDVHDEVINVFHVLLPFAGVKATDQHAADAGQADDKDRQHPRYPALNIK